MDPLEVKRYVEDYFSRFPLIRPPKHILVLSEPLVLETPEARLLFSGMQPSWRPDTIIVSWPLLRRDTLLHETLHTYGCGENCAWLIAPRLAMVREKHPPLVRRKIKYRICNGGEGCSYRELHEKLRQKLLHLVRE